MTIFAYEMCSYPVSAVQVAGGFGDYSFIIMMLIIFGILYYFVKKPKNLNDIDHYLSRLQDFTVTQKIMGVDGFSGLAIDEHRKKVCLIYCRQKQFRIFSYGDLISSELYEDGETISKTMRGSQIGGALVGTFLLGGVGTIVGGLSAKRKTEGTVTRIDLRLIVNDTSNPVFEINFLNKEVKKGSQIYMQIIQHARHCYGLIEVLIKRADVDHKQQAPAVTSTPLIQQGIPITSIADEVKKLAHLRDTGVLTDKEFEKQKGKLLAD